MATTDVRNALIREELLDRRQKLEGALSTYREHAALHQLLRQVDEALQEIEDRSFGLCEVCQDPVEEDRLLANPLLKHCLDHLTPHEQRALQQDIDLTARIQGELLPSKRLVLDGLEAVYHYEPLGAVGG